MHTHLSSASAIYLQQLSTILALHHRGMLCDHKQSHGEGSSSPSSALTTMASRRASPLGRMARRASTRLASRSSSPPPPRPRGSCSSRSCSVPSSTTSCYCLVFLTVAWYAVDSPGNGLKPTLCLTPPKNNILIYLI